MSSAVAPSPAPSSGSLLVTDSSRTGGAGSHPSATVIDTSIVTI
jgi:hypothetical protein